MTTSFSRHLKLATMGQAGGVEEQNGDAVGWDVVAAEVVDEALELLEPSGAAFIALEVDVLAVDAGFDAPPRIRDERALLGDGAGVAAVEGEAFAHAEIGGREDVLALATGAIRLGFIFPSMQE